MRELRKRGVYFQKYYSKVIGKPDIALPRKKKAVFIDGDFWHGYQFAKNKNRRPKKYWVQKIAGNIARDKKNTATLERRGWKVLRIWEHEIHNDVSRVAKDIIIFLK
jgi:DNA mismatch endonuclease (patch repair protein)